MGKVNGLKTFTKNQFAALKYALKHNYQIKYCIEEIDTNTQEILLRCRGTDTIIKLTYEAAISDAMILEGLSAEQACLLGGYYGRVMRAESGNHKHRAMKMKFLLHKHSGYYRIISQDRTGKIAYVDTSDNKEYVEYPLTIVSSRHIISKFDPSQACYLGMLAGVSIEKTLQSDKKNNEDQLHQMAAQRPKLRVVK